MIDLTAKIDNDEALRKLRQLQQTAKQTTSSVVTDADRMDMAMARIGRTLGQLGVGISLAGLVRQVGQVRGEFQKLEIAFSTMLQSETNATALMAQLTRTAATTPFGLQDVANGAKQLLAYGTEAEKVNETLIRLGDIAAGLSIPLGDLVYLYGTTQTQGRLFTQDLRQFQGRGIPLAEELAKQFKVTSAEVGKLVTAGKVGFPEVEKAIISMTSQGGKFGGLMEAQSKTINGLVSNLEDAFDVMFNEIGQKTEGAFVGVLETSIGLVENYEKVIDILVPLIATYGSYKAALIVVAAAHKVNNAVLREAVIIKNAEIAAGRAVTKAQAVQLAQTKLLTNGWRALATSIKATTVALIASPITWITAALAGLSYVIYRVATAETEQEKAQRKVNEAMDDYKTKQEELKSKAEELHGIIKDESTTTYQQEKAYRELIKAYPELLDKYSKEKILLMDIVALRREIAGITDTRDRSFVEANYKQALADYNYYNERTGRVTEIASKEDVKAGKAAFVGEQIRAPRDYKRAQAALELSEQYKKQLDEIDRIQAESASTDDKIAKKQAEINRLKEEEKRINQDIADAQKSASGNGTTKTIIPSAKSEDVLQAQKQSNIDRQKQLELEIKNLKEGQKATKTPLSDEEQKRLKKIADINTQLEKEASQAQINAMKEGLPKVLAQIDLDYDQREAEIKKRETELKALQGGKLTDEQMAAFGAIRKGNTAQRESERMYAMYDLGSLWEQEQAMDQAMEQQKQAMRDYLMEFGTYQERLQAMVADFDAKIEEATSEGERLAIQEEKDAALAEMEVKASEWAQELVDLTISQLDKTISEVEAQLDLAKSEYDALDSSDSDEGKELRAKIRSLQAKIKVLQSQREVTDAQNEVDTAPSKESLKEWQDLHETLGRVADGFKELGDEIGGTVGNVIGSAGEIATSTLSMINGIMTLTNWSVRAAELTAQGASEAIQQVERASVILAIIQAAIKVVTALVKLFGKGADYSDYNALKEKYDQLNEVWDELIEKKETYINMSYGAEAKKVGEEAIAIVNQQIEAYRELGVARLNAGTSAGSHSIGKRIQKSMSAEGWAQLRAASADLGFDYDSVAGGRMTGLFELSIEQLEELKEKAPSFWAQLDEEVRDYLNQIIEGQARIEELQEAYKESLTQVSFDNVFDSFVDTLMDMDASAEDFSNQFSEYMMKAILTTQIGDAYRERLQEWYNKFATANEDSDITTEEIDRLRSEWDDMVKQALELRDGIADITGYGEAMASQQETTSKGFQTMDQETGSELNGRFTDMQGKMAEQLGLSRQAIERMEYIRNLSEQQLHAQIDTRDILINISGNVSEIRAFTEALPLIHEAVTKTNKILDDRL